MTQEVLDLAKRAGFDLHGKKLTWEDADCTAELIRFANFIEEKVLAKHATQKFILHDEENEGGWSDWICPKPDSYLIKCCDCGLVHETQTRVAEYEPRPSEDFNVSNNPDLQAQFRVRRHETAHGTKENT